MELQVGVKALLKGKNGKYLLQRRSQTKYPNAQIGWDLVGGRIIPGVSLLANLRREVKEETGLKLLGVDKILGVQDILRIKGKHVVRISFFGHVSGTVKLDKSENTECKWFTLKEIRELPKKSLDMYFLKLLEREDLKI